MKTLVIFRKEKNGDITAVFPYDPGTDDPSTMSCYAHLGQHSSCSMEWYYTTSPAKPNEYADLKAELENYGPPDAHYDLIVRRRMPSDAYSRRLAELRQIA